MNSIYNKIKNQYSFLTKNIKTNANSTIKKSKRGHLQGVYIPKNKDKFIVLKNKQNGGKIKFRSSWEYKFLQWCDQNKNVKKVVSEGIPIPYYFENKKRKYYPDFLLLYKDEKLLIEIKPKNQVLNEMNQAKFNAAKKFCEQNNYKFLILTEIELKNLISKN